MVRRRRATQEELAEGERQMKAAQERLAREAQDHAIQDQVNSGDQQRAGDERSEFLVPLEGALVESETRLVTTPNPPGLNAEERHVVSGPVSGERVTATLEDRQNETEVRQASRTPGESAAVPNGGQEPPAHANLAVGLLNYAQGVFWQEETPVGFNSWQETPRGFCFRKETPRVFSSLKRFARPIYHVLWRYGKQIVI